MRIIKLPDNYDVNHCKAMELVREVNYCPYCDNNIIANSQIVYAYPEDMLDRIHGPFRRIRARYKCHYNSVIKTYCKECGTVIRSSPISDMYKSLLEKVRDEAIRNSTMVMKNNKIVNNKNK